MLVDGAALGRHIAPDGRQSRLQARAAVDDQKLGLAQPTLHEVIENRSPGLLCLATHVLHGQQYFLAVLADPEHDQQRDRCGLFVEPDPYHGAVENQADDRLFGERAIVPCLPIALHLPPHPAHRVLAHRAAEQRRERTAHPARVGAGQVGACNQRIGGSRAPLIGGQRLASPLTGLAVGGHQPGARNADLHLAECSQEGSRPMAVPVTDEACQDVVGLVPGLCRAAVAWPRQRRLELRLDHALNKAPHPIADARFNWVEPVVKKLGARLSFRM